MVAARGQGANHGREQALEQLQGQAPPRLAGGFAAELPAQQALAESLILVTANMREFSRVPGLTVENWQT